MRGMQQNSSGWPAARMVGCLAAILASVLALPARAADEPSPEASLGRSIAEFTLSDHRGKEVALGDFAEQKLVAVVFLGVECPLAKLYAPRLAKLHEEFAGRGVAFVAIDSNAQDSASEIGAYVRKHALPFPLLKDPGNKIADAFGAERTPEAFVLDGERRIRYRGRIDDQYDVGVIRGESRREDLRAALDELLAGQEVSQPLTEAVGCHIGRVREPAADAPVTFANQISRLFQQRCVECHREGEIAPFALTDYEEAAGWAETALEAVEAERMPPWHAAPGHAPLAEDRRLTADERELLARWVADGAPLGDPADLPPPREFVEGWQLEREPDRVIAMRSEPFDVPAEGEVKYQYFLSDEVIEEESWLQAAEVRPGNRAVVHHVLVFAVPPGGRPAGEGGLRGFLAAYVPGIRAVPYPPGMAKRIPADSRLLFQVHYTPIGSPQQDVCQIGLLFAKDEDVQLEVMTTSAVSRRLEIPPGEANHVVEADSARAPWPVQILAFMPHMHLRGKSFRYEAVLPDGERRVLLDVPRYDFNWQTRYRLAEPLTLPSGAQMHCTAAYDNSEDNPHNPDSTATVGWGDQTWEEMMIGYFDIALPRGALGAEAAGGGEAAPVDFAARAKEAFQRLDKNADGFVTVEEIPERFAFIFRRVDADGDGQVTKEELEAGMRRWRDLLR